VIRWSLLAGLFLAIVWWLPGLLHIYTQWLWFNFDVRFPDVFWKILTTKLGLGLAFGAVFFVVVVANIEIARRFAHRTSCTTKSAPSASG